jgi:hypothetical protein
MKVIVSRFATFAFLVLGDEVELAAPRLNGQSRMGRSPDTSTQGFESAANHWVRNTMRLLT